MCLSLDLCLYYNIDTEEPKGFNSNIALSYAKHIPTLRVISMVISHPQYDIRFPEDEDATSWWIVTRVGPSVDLVAVYSNEGECMKRIYNEETFVDGTT